jgi:DNA-binding MarR family transcriptional regulator
MLAEVDVLEISPKVSLIIKELERRGLVITTPNPVQKL